MEVSAWVKETRCLTYLKLAVSIHAHPIFTTQRAASTASAAVALPVSGVGFKLEQGKVLSGNKKPLSLANCSKHIGRKSVKETMTKTSLNIKWHSA